MLIFASDSYSPGCISAQSSQAQALERADRHAINRNSASGVSQVLQDGDHASIKKEDGNDAES